MFFEARRWSVRAPVAAPIDFPTADPLQRMGQGNMPTRSFDAGMTSPGKPRIERPAGQIILNFIARDREEHFLLLLGGASAAERL